jgi:hypothetical protein
MQLPSILQGESLTRLLQGGRTHRGMRKVLLFSKDILVAEWLRDKPRRDRLAAKRARLRAKNKAWTA